MIWLLGTSLVVIWLFGTGLVVVWLLWTGLVGLVSRGRLFWRVSPNLDISLSVEALISGISSPFCSDLMRQSSLSSASEVGSLGGAAGVSVDRTGVVDLNVDPLFEADDDTLLEEESPEETLFDGETVEEALLGEMVVVALLNETPGEDANVTTRGGTMSLISGSSRTSGFLEIVDVSGWTTGNVFFSSNSFFSASVFSLISSFFFFSLTT